jgi:hypothetical protein
MVTRFIGVLFLLVAVVGYASAEEPDMPLTRAKVGDWVLFKMDNPQSKMSMRMEVTEVTDKTVTIKSVTTINGMELPVDVKTMDKISKGDPAVEQRNRKEFNYVDTGKGRRR